MSARAGGANAPERWHVIHDTGAALFTERNLREQIGLLPFGSAINAIEHGGVNHGGLLEVVHPVQGWLAKRSSNGRTLVAEGGLERAAAFRYEVVYESGAFVRDGKELSARQVHTFPKHSIVDVYERCINEQGLARLQVKAPHRERPLGWISERLNPMSGQRGPICRPLPMACPLVYRVVFATGAVVRADIELISRKVGIIQYNSLVVVSEKCFTHHPAERCVPRLRLADGSGWISLRTNDPPSQARDIVRLVGVEEREALRRHTFTLDDIRAHWEESKMNEADGRPRRSCNMWDDPEGEGQAKEAQDQTRRFAQAMKKVHSEEEPVKGDEGDVTCLICFDQPRNATIVHGSTGHVCSCLDCARLLCARGDVCPVCRMQIDNIIENIWAPPMSPHPALLEPSSFALRKLSKRPSATLEEDDNGLRKEDEDSQKLVALQRRWWTDPEADNAAPWHVIATDGADIFEEMSGSDDASFSSQGAPLLNFENPLMRLPFGTLVLAQARDSENEVLRVFRPVRGYAYVKSLSGKYLLRPGQLEEAARWYYEVVLPTGAYVRAGVELTSRHTHTFPVHEIIEARGRCFNTQHLARLQVYSPHTEGQELGDAIGWISEMLNPISAQHGAIVTQVPMVCPLQYRVIYREGAVVRRGIELESERVAHIPAGQIVTVVEKMFSNHPASRCVPRLKLAGNAGWISQRLNAVLESDSHDIVEVVGPHPTEALHRMCPRVQNLRSQKIEGAEDVHLVRADNAAGAVPPRGVPRSRSGGTATKEATVRDDWTLVDHEASDGAQLKEVQSDQNLAPPTELCAVCGVNPRTATLIHEEFGKELGHVVVCVDCGNQLKSLHRGCPVCGMPIENVIQHFWA